MQTAQAVEDGALSNEHFGIIFKRVIEITKRIRQKQLTIQFVLDELQRIYDGKPRAVPVAAPAEPLRGATWAPPARPFTRPNRTERRKSRSPYAMRLPGSLDRLTNWPYRNEEHVLAELWEALNIPDRMSGGRVLVQQVLDQKEVLSFDNLTPHDIKTVASTIQWLGTNSGKAFLSLAVRTAQIHI